MLGSEIYAHRFNSPTSGNPVFVGGDVVASYMITGESRPYNTALPILGFVPVSDQSLRVDREHGKCWSGIQVLTSMEALFKGENLEDHADGQLVFVERRSFGVGLWIRCARPVQPERGYSILSKPASINPFIGENISVL